MCIMNAGEHVDPVCGMRVDPSASKYKTIYKGKVYYFCSLYCLREFERKPEFYLREGPQGMPTEHSEHNWVKHQREKARD